MPLLSSQWASPKRVDACPRRHDPRVQGRIRCAIASASRSDARRWRGRGAERRPIPELRPGARREEVRRPPVGDDGACSPRPPPSRAPSSPSAWPTPAPRASGSTAAKPRKPASSGRTMPLCMPDTSTEQPIAEPTTRPSTTATKVAYFGSSKSSSHSALASSTARGASGENTGERCWCAGSASSSSARDVDVVARRRGGSRPRPAARSAASPAPRGSRGRAAARSRAGTTRRRGPRRRRARSRSGTCGPPRPSGRRPSA